MANVYQKDGMVISAGCVYGLNKDSWLASADGGIVVEFNPEVYLNQAEKDHVSAFVKEAYEAPEGR